MSEKRKKAKQYYTQQHKKHKRPTLEVGMKGFLCSCNNREKECIRESYNLLNKYHDILHPSSTNDAAKVELEVEDELESEIKQLQSTNSQKKRLFQALESGAKNFLFVKTTAEDPVELAEAICKDLSQTKSEQTRNLLRLVPIETVCKATVADIREQIGPLLDKHFVDTPQTFSVFFNHRNNNSISKDEVIDAVAKMVSERNGENKVDLKEAKTTVVVEIIKGFALLSVVPNFIQFKKYNLHSICDGEGAAIEPNSG